MSTSTQIESWIEDDGDHISAGGVVVFKWRACAGLPLEYVSANVEQVFGYSASEFASGRLQWSDLIHPADRERVRDRIDPSLRGDNAQGVHEHYRVVRADGTIAHVDEANRVARDEAGEPRSYVSHIVDVTDRHEAESRLRQRKATLAEALEIAQLGYWEWNVATDELYWSDEVYEMLGLAIGEVEPSHAIVRQLTHPDDREFFDEVSRTVIERQNPYDATHRIMRRDDGEVRYLRGRGRPYLEDGRTVRVVGTIQDITETVRAEEVLRSERSWLESLIQAMPDGISFRDPQGRWLVANHIALDFFGLQGVDYRGKSGLELAELSPNYGRAVHNCIRTDKQVWKAGRTTTFEQSIPHASDGRLTDFEVIKVPVYHSDGSPQGMLVVGRDITERKRAEEALQQSKSRLDKAQEIAHLGSWELDLQTGQVDWSDEVYRLYGLEPAERDIDLDFVMQHLPEADRTRVQEVMEEVCALGEPFEFEHRLIRTDGTGRVAHTEGECGFDADGNVAVLFGIIRDVTEVREAESMKRRLGRILDESSNEILVFDADSLHFLQVNRGARHNLGYSEAEFAQMTPLQLNSRHNDRERFEALVEPLRRGDRTTVTFEEEYRRKDGSTYPVEVRLQLSHAETPPVFVSIAQDITERKKVERLKEEFVSIVSHELRTPLTPITGVLALLSGGGGGELSPRAQKMVDLALRNSHRLLYLIDDLLDIQKMSSGQMDFELAEIDLVETIEESLRVNSSLEIQAEVSFRFEPSRRAAAVMADKGRIIQVMTNLLSNAAKFSPSNSDVEILLEQCAEETVRVSVRDRGPGIPEDFRHRVFEKFAQADSSSTRKHGGTGLGLAISRSIIDRHGGFIDFRTEMGEGTTFFFDLPLLSGE